MRDLLRGAVVVFAVSLTSSCLSPTEIILELGTDVACSFVQANGVAIAIGAPGDDGSLITTTTLMCSPDGGIGSLVLVPSGSSTGEVGIRVTLGIDASVEQCAEPSFDGCIVARRSLRYDPHTPLTLPIDLDQSCIGVPCTPDSTCVSGSCVDASVGPCTGVCNVEDAGPADAATDANPDAEPTAPSVLMVGGSTDCSGAGPPIPVLNETWSWNGTSWTALSAEPSANYLFSMATLGNDSVLFGGIDSTSAYLGATAVWNGTSWISTTPIPTPGARAFSGMAMSGSSIVLFGGCSGGCYTAAGAFGDTWTWDSTVGWNNPSVTAPSPRQSHAMATLGTDVVLFGGTPYFGGSDLADTWVYDGASWTQKTVAAPSARDGHAMATLGYNVVLFGGEFYKAGYELAPAETWIWNGTTWSSYTGTPQPSARYYASMATFGNEVLLFGGFNGSTALGDTWVWNGSGWAQQSVSGGPIARCGHALVSR